MLKFCLNYKNINVGHWGGQNNDPKDDHVPTPRTGGCIILFGKKRFTGVIKSLAMGREFRDVQAGPM